MAIPKKSVPFGKIKNEKTRKFVKNSFFIVTVLGALVGESIPIFDPDLLK